MEASGQTQMATMADGGSVVLDIESLAQSSNQCSGSPKFTKALSRKGSCRMDRRGGEDIHMDDASKNVLMKNSSLQLDQSRQIHPMSKPPIPVPGIANSICSNIDVADGTKKRFSRFQIIHPRRILLFFATMSSMGTMILIYFTLAINRRNST